MRAGGPPVVLRRRREPADRRPPDPGRRRRGSPPLPSRPVLRWNEPPDLDSPLLTGPRRRRCWVRCRGAWRRSRRCRGRRWSRRSRGRLEHLDLARSRGIRARWASAWRWCGGGLAPSEGVQATLQQGAREARRLAAPHPTPGAADVGRCGRRAASGNVRQARGGWRRRRRRACWRVAALLSDRRRRERIEPLLGEGGGWARRCFRWSTTGA